MDDHFQNYVERSDEDDGDCDQEMQESPPTSPPPQPPHGTGVLGLWWPPLRSAGGGPQLPVPPSPSPSPPMPRLDDNKATPPSSTPATAPPPPLGFRWPPLPRPAGAHPALLLPKVPTPLVRRPPLMVSSWPPPPPAPAPAPTPPHVSPPPTASTPAAPPPYPHRARPRPEPKPPREYCCRYCPFRSQESDLQRHLSRRHANKRSSRCPNCGCRFKTDFLTHKC